jgi:hypothetical protein
VNVTLRAYRILQMRSHKHKRDSGRRIWSQMVDSFVRCTVGVHADTILADINVCLSYKPRHKSALSLSWYASIVAAQARCVVHAAATRHAHTAGQTRRARVAIAANFPVPSAGLTRNVFAAIVACPTA